MEYNDNEATRAGRLRSRTRRRTQPGIRACDSVIYSHARPSLLDVRLMAMSPQAFTLTGFERVAGVEYAAVMARRELRSLKSR